MGYKRWKRDLAALLVLQWMNETNDSVFTSRDLSHKSKLWGDREFLNSKEIGKSLSSLWDKKAVSRTSPKWPNGWCYQYTVINKEMIRNSIHGGNVKHYQASFSFLP